MIEIHKRKGQANGEEFNKEVSLDLALSHKVCPSSLNFCAAVKFPSRHSHSGGR